MGAPLYQWHATHHDKGLRFRMAMESVTKSTSAFYLGRRCKPPNKNKALDPGDNLFCDWFEEHAKVGDLSYTVVDVLGGNKMSQPVFAKQFHHLSFESAATIDDVPGYQEPILAYTVRNIFWNKTDKEIIAIITGLVKAMEQHREATLLINEMLSPSKGDFNGELEHAYRRRDVTTMTMHNAKQRTKAEWRGLFNEIGPQLQVSCAQPRLCRSKVQKSPRLIFARFSLVQATPLTATEGSGSCD
jgi:hypothetical protein